MKAYRGSQEPEQSTKDRLADALTAAGAPHTMIELARRGHYDDYESALATPIHQLVRDCLAIGLRSVAERASEGEFDGTREEADAWFKREGQYLFGGQR